MDCKQVGASYDVFIMISLHACSKLVSLHTLAWGNAAWLSSRPQAFTQAFVTWEPGNKARILTLERLTYVAILDGHHLFIENDKSSFSSDHGPHLLGLKMQKCLGPC